MSQPNLSNVRVTRVTVVSQRQPRRSVRRSRSSLLSLFLLLVLSVLFVVIARRVVRWAMAATVESPVVRHVVAAVDFAGAEVSSIKADAAALGETAAEWYRWMRVQDLRAIVKAARKRVAKAVDPEEDR